MWSKLLVPMTLAVLFALCASFCTAAELHVPAQFPTIQEAIDAASEGDTVIVAPGRYAAICLLNNSITLASTDPGSPEIVRSTVIEQYPTSGISVILATSSNPWLPLPPPRPLVQRSVINGFTIEGGVSCGTTDMTKNYVNSPTILNNIIGRGIGASYSSPCIAGNSVTGGISVDQNKEEVIISGNTVHSARYEGIYISDTRAPVIVADNTIVDNVWFGLCSEGELRVLHILRNRISGNSGGIAVESGQVIGNIIYGNVNSSTLPVPMPFLRAGICVMGDDHLIEGNIIAGNQGDGGGIVLRTYLPCPAWIKNNLISGNRSFFLASAIDQFVRNKGGQVAGNTIIGNAGGPSAVEILVESSKGFMVANNVVRDNLPNRLSLGPRYGVVRVRHSNIQGGRDMVSPSVTWGPGNIDADPLFVDPGHWDDAGTPSDPSDDSFVLGDYHLLPGSPCIDAGTNDVDNPDTPEIETLPDTDIAGLPRVIDGNLDGTATVDMGAYEYLAGDVNYDGRVNVLDLLLVRNSMGSDPASSIEARKADVNADGSVNVQDLLIVRGRLGR